VILVFDWDERKAKANLKRHGISFDQAGEVFEDPFCVIEPNYHYEDENEARYQAIERTRSGEVLLLVVFVDRTKTEEENEKIVIRIISARKATNYEETAYRENSPA
jgi:hypothetical protein